MEFDNSKHEMRKQQLQKLLNDPNVIRPGNDKSSKLKAERIYLLGSFPQGTYNPTTSWRVEAHDTLRRHSFAGTILSPELHGQANVVDGDKWQQSFMPHANRFVVWFDNHSQFSDEVAIFLLGAILKSRHHHGQIFVGWEDPQKRTWLRAELEKERLHVFSSLSSLCQAAAVGRR